MIISNISYCDTPLNWQFGFQDPASPIMEGLIHLHHDIVFYELIIFILVFWIFVRAFVFFEAPENITNIKYRYPINYNAYLEFGWTMLPIIVLLLISGPTFILLYSIEDLIAPDLTIKIIGHQWYWCYEYADFQFEDSNGGSCLTTQSYMVLEEDLAIGELRLLEAFERLVLPVNTNIRLLITSADVLHSWAVPSLGIKLDACPGRINETSLYINRAGVFYGQCSEICGVNHGFMPIAISAVTLDEFNGYINCVIKENE